MGTLLTGSVDLTTLERAYTVADLALILNESEAWVRECQRKEIITPLPTRKGGIQYSRGSLLRLQALRVLQMEFGMNSALPARIVKSAGGKLDALGKGPELFTTDAQAALVAGLMAAVFSPEVLAELDRRFATLEGCGR